MVSSGEEGKAHISEMTREFLDQSANVVDRGPTDLKNKGSMNTYFLEQLV